MRKLKNVFWSITGDFIYRHHVEPRVKLFMPEKSFPVPFKNIDVTRNTHTSLDVQGGRVVTSGHFFIVSNHKVFCLKFAEEMLARLALGSGRRISRKISTSRRLDLDVICFSDEKIFRVDAAAPGRSFHTFYRWKLGRRNNATSPFSGYTMRKGRVALLRRSIFEPLFTTHPSEVGSTTPLTVLAAMLRGPLSHPICRQTTAFCVVWSAIQSASALQTCPLSAHSNRCVIAFHG